MNLKVISRLMLISIIALMVLGSVMVLSASSTYSALKFDNYYKLFQFHLSRVLLAGLALIVAASIPYGCYKKFCKLFLILIGVVLVITMIIAPDVKGAGRWLNLGFFSFQPSEIAKYALIVHIAYLIESKGEQIKELHGFKIPLLWIGGIVGLVVIQPNLSTSIIIFTAAFTLLFIGGARIKHILTTLVSAGGILITAMMLFSHSRARVMTFINSFQKGGEINIQVAQAKIALGSGGFLGVGLGQSRQSDLFLPEAYGDFIFSILGEELGFIGGVAVLFLYMAIFFFGIVIAKRSADKFGQLLAFGISFTIILNAFINAAVVTGIFPTTGIPLPFVSYGGTNIVFTCYAAGIVVNIGVLNSKLQPESGKIFKKKNDTKIKQI